MGDTIEREFKVAFGEQRDKLAKLWLATWAFSFNDPDRPFRFENVAIRELRADVIGWRFAEISDRQNEPLFRHVAKIFDIPWNGSDISPQLALFGVFGDGSLSAGGGSKKTDYLQEKMALQELAARMADQPEEVLPRFVDLALEMTGGVSGGLSLYEEEPAFGVFRWQYLRGLLAPFNGGDNPAGLQPVGHHAGPQWPGALAASRAGL
jgi:hypothetical protein